MSDYILVGEDERWEITIMVSRNFLIEPLPDDFREMEEDDQDEFLTNHAWQPFEHFPPSVLYSNIDAAAYEVCRYIQRTYLNKEVDSA